MKPVQIFLFFISFCLLVSCATSIKNYDPNKQYPKEKLQQDFTLLENILESKHPSLYWYTSKDSMDMYFNKYYNAIEDSMTEQRFGWKILAPLVSKIHCGHTSFGMSIKYNKWVAKKRLASFPLYLKIWNDTMAITANLDRKDTVLKKGTLITAVNGMNCSTIVKNIFNFLPEDGYADNVNYSRISNNFPYYHRNIFGLYKSYTVNYLDTAGKEQTIKVPYFTAPKDSLARNKIDRLVKKEKRETKGQKLLGARSLAIDTANNTAVITLNTFSKGKLRQFFRQTFHRIKKDNINNVVLDIRSNGGGKINLSTLLTRYVTRVPFKVADSAYTVTRSLGKYTKYVKGNFWNNIGLFFLTKKHADGKYHFGHLEKKLYQPKSNNHFGGNLYVLINGPTFSASTLFCNAVKGQPGVTLIGEEAGGGWHGNNGIFIPDITLPNTHLRVRLPLFRLIQYNHVPKNGEGVMPDIYVGTNYDALLKSYDKKMQVVMELIKKNRQ